MSSQQTVSTFSINQPEYTEEDLNAMTVAQLKELADSNEITYKSNILKADLINLILNK